ncbi:MAG: SdpI family protein, partial [Gammaproteobacteria bacterium]|nr:SdpI family protein [Gammaproteobacteria bacterium]
IGADIPIEVIVPVLVGVIFIIIGNYLPKTKQNPVAGVRLPWAMESAENWRRTSRFSGYLFIIGGFVMILNAFFALFWIPVFFGILIAMIAGPVIYSYHLHKKGI